MPKFGKPHPPEFRRQMIDLVCAGRTSEHLSREFEPTAQSIHNCVAEAERKGDCHKAGLSAVEREELLRLRRENRQLKLEREILKKAAAWFAREAVPNSKKSSGL